MRAKIVLAAALLGVAAVAVYAPVQGHPWVWDDETHIAENPSVTAGVPLARYFFDPNTTTTRPDYNHEIYRPLRNLAYRAVAVLFGVSPAPFEAASLFLYVVLTILLLLALHSLVGDLQAAVIATALWLLLPVHVQAVAYPSALGDLISAVIELGALACGLRAARDEKFVTWGAASLVLGAASMFAKEMAVTEPLVLALILWLDGRLRSRRSLALVGAHLAAALGYVVTRSLVLGRVAQRSITTEKLLLGLKKAPILLVEYARLSVMPLGHRAFYSVAEGWGDLAIALAVIALAAFAGWRFRRRAFTAGLVGFTLALLPVLQLLPITTDLADRFALFPSLGLALAVAAGVAALSPARRRLASLAAGAAALVLLGGTLLEERMWMSDGALWRYTVDRDPGVGTSHGNLANVLLKEGRPAEALAEIDRARELGFDGPFMWVRRARALDELGRREEAAAALRAALKETPSSGQLHAVLGDIYRRSGHLAEALAELELAEKYAPNAAVTINLGRALR